MEQFCFLNGEILPLKEARVSVMDIGLLRGYGIYDGLAAFGGAPFRFHDHWERFLNGAHFLNLNVPITEEKMERVIKELLQKNKHTRRANIRVILTGGDTIAGIEYDFQKPTFYILTEEHEPLPADLYSKGAKLVTYHYQRETPEHKTINYTTAVNLQSWRKSEEAVEILYTYEGAVLECATSNIFIVKDNILITPSEKVLGGITKKVVMELAAPDYRIEQRPAAEPELEAADEVFITSSFKDIVPITKIDDYKIGSGAVGPVTKDLMAKFAQITQI